MCSEVTGKSKEDLRREARKQRFLEIAIGTAIVGVPIFLASGWIFALVYRKQLKEIHKTARELDLAFVTTLDDFRARGLI